MLIGKAHLRGNLIWFTFNELYELKLNKLY